MKPIHPQRFQALITAAQQAAFSGWDFSWLEERMITSDLPWDYTSLVQTHCSQAKCLLDMGTGGGEFLASMEPLPPEVHATECYPPNQPLAKARLAPLGITVHDIAEDDPLPFENEYCDLVINRHESYDPGEVFRILKLGGIFITQQVGALDNLELNQLLAAEQTSQLTDWGLETETLRLVDAGLTVIRAEKAALQTEFRDIGAVVYYLKAIPWQVADFSLESHTEKLVPIHNFIETHGAFITTAHRFLIIARKEAHLL